MKITAKKIVAARKKCSKCGKKMSVNKFWKDKSTTSGYRSACKECSKK